MRRIPFSRLPGLGTYKGNRADWLTVYRMARIRSRYGLQPNPRFGGLYWKAQLIINKRHEHDPLSNGIQARLTLKRLIDEVLAHD